MTQNEKSIINQTIKNIQLECDTLEELYLQTRSINLRWIKQSLEEKTINTLRSLLK